ncbi:LOW QUALITY PROTEIN: predicted protein, partial [Mycobacterium tuberculosis T85]
RHTGIHRRRPGRRRSRGLPAAQLPGRAPLCARPLSDDVCEPAVDHPPVRRVFHRRGFQCVLPTQPGRRPEGAVGGLRSGHPPRLRLRPSPRAGRCRNGRCGNRFHSRHATAVRRHRPVDRERVDDDERCGAADPGAVCGCRRGAGRGAGAAGRHHPERHPQRVHGPQHLHLSAEAVDADHLRHLRLHQRQDAQVQLHLHFRLSHPRSRCHGGFGAGLHPGRRRRLHQGGPERRPGHRQLRAPAIVLLGHRDEFLYGGRQTAGRPVAVE